MWNGIQVVKHVLFPRAHMRFQFINIFELKHGDLNNMDIDFQTTYF